jgi:hypothetical protein
MTTRRVIRTWYLDLMMIDGVPKNEKRIKGAAEEGPVVTFSALRCVISWQVNSRILWPAIPGRSCSVEAKCTLHFDLRFDFAFPVQVPVSDTPRSRYFPSCTAADAVHRHVSALHA